MRRKAGQLTGCMVLIIGGSTLLKQDTGHGVVSIRSSTQPRSQHRKWPRRLLRCSQCLTTLATKEVGMHRHSDQLCAQALEDLVGDVPTSGCAASFDVTDVPNINTVFERTQEPVGIL